MQAPPRESLVAMTVDTGIGVSLMKALGRKRYYALAHTLIELTQEMLSG
jgi:hypothetical protein